MHASECTFNSMAPLLVTRPATIYPTSGNGTASGLSTTAVIIIVVAVVVVLLLVLLTICLCR